MRISLNKNQEELERIISNVAVGNNVDNITPSFIWKCSLTELANAILSAGYHKGKVIEGKEAVEFLKDAGYVKLSDVELDEFPPDEYFEYDKPFSERYEKFVEPLIKPICDMINKSGWVWIGESCEGHNPKINPTSNWGTEKVLLRFITATSNVGRLLGIFREVDSHTTSALRIKYEIYVQRSDKYSILICYFSGLTIPDVRIFCKLIAHAIATAKGIMKVKK